MRKFLIKNFALSYESKFAGNIGRHPRATNYTITMIAIAIIYHGLFEPMEWFEYAIWIPFIICIYLGFFYFKANPISYAEVEDWEQKYQFLNKPTMIGTKDKTFPSGLEYQHEIDKYAKIYNAKYKTDADFVEAKRIIYPFAVIIFLVVLAAIGVFNFASF